MNVYEIVTAKIIEKLESGVAPWQQPWRTDPPCNLITGRPYRGVNPFLLIPAGFGSRYWLTMNQANKLGGRILKGEKSSLVTFWKIGQEKITTDANGHERKSRPFILRFYSVWNVLQTDLADKLGITGASERTPSLDECERIVAGMPNPPRIEQSDKAWYRPSLDVVGIPTKTAFDSAEEYFSTMFHELAHATGNAKRPGRDGIMEHNQFGSEDYSKEELIAELAASMLAGVCGITPRTLDNSASYLQTWVRRLRGDSKLIVSAASQAQKAADYVRGIAQRAEVEA